MGTINRTSWGAKRRRNLFWLRIAKFNAKMEIGFSERHGLIIREDRAVSELRITGLSEDMSALAALSWRKRVEDWPEDPTLTSMRGISRHIVRLIRTGPGDRDVFAVKETVEEFATREYAILRELNTRHAPCVEPVAIIENRLDKQGMPLPVALVTRYLPFSLPYRVIMSS